jgi:hypothetical protein
VDAPLIATIQNTQTALNLIAVKMAADQQAQLVQMLQNAADSAPKANLPAHLGSVIDTTA